MLQGLMASSIVGSGSKPRSFIGLLFITKPPFVRYTQNVQGIVYLDLTVRAWAAVPKAHIKNYKFLR
jgi:hypothetical protein